MRTLRLGTLSALALLALATACGDDKKDNNDTPKATAQIRVVHASPDAPAVDVYVKGSTTPAFKNIAYGSASSFETVAAGSYQFEIRPAGAAASSAAVYTTDAVTLTKDGKFDAIAAGFLNGTAADDKFRVLALQESFAAPAAGKIRVRIVHAGADAPAVGIDVGDDGSVEVAGLARFSDTGAAGVELPASALQVGIYSGTTRVTGFSIPALPAGTQALVIATGKLSKLPREAQGFGLLVPGAGILKQNPRVYALHASPGAPAVDVYTGSTKLVDNISFGQLKGVQVPPGAYPLSIFAHSANGSGSPVVPPINSPALAAGEQYLVAADGFLTPPTGNTNGFTLLAFQEAFDLGDTGTKARLRLVHGAPDVPAVDLGVIAGGSFTQLPGLTGITYKQETGPAGLAIDPGTYTLGVRLTGTSTVLGFNAGAIPAGLRAFVIAAGALDSATATPVRALVVNTSVTPWTVAAISPNP